MVGTTDERLDYSELTPYAIRNNLVIVNLFKIIKQKETKSKNLDLSFGENFGNFSGNSFLRKGFNSLALANPYIAVCQVA